MDKRKAILSAIAASLLASGTVYGQNGGGAGGLRFTADLLGTKEVPSVDTQANAQVILRFNGDRSLLSYFLRIRKGTAITAAHLHCGPIGADGPIVAHLLGPITGNWSRTLEIRAVLTEANVINEASQGLNGGATCSSLIQMPVNSLSDLAEAARSGLIYANVHSVENPGGEVRGQLRKKRGGGTDNGGTGGGGTNTGGYGPY